jgi:2-polyprenyl-3-methyl-5-hydroxy-6-metoxy-1,4-benzoquinol methylase
MYSEGALMDGYDLVICIRCGAAFADEIPKQEAFDTYYAKMSKYEHSHRDGDASSVDTARFRQIVDLIAPHVQPHESLVDVGCANGGLLAEFKQRGFRNLLGFDPSTASAAAAKRLYGIEVRPMAIRDLSTVRERFDAAVLTGVLEHLCDVDSSLRLVCALLNPGGRLYIAVPDATRYRNWFSAPFQFLSMEHVNFFSQQSLANLLARHGFECVFSKRMKSFLGPQAVEPTIAGLFQRSSSPNKPRLEYDSETEPALRDYIKLSKELDAKVSAQIGRLVDTHIPLLVWGVGTHTLRLLETSPLARANILAFIDSNPRYQGKRLRDISIIGPQDVHDQSATILISSHTAEQEIKNCILDDLKWPNPIVCLYEDAPLELSLNQ